MTRTQYARWLRLSDGLAAEAYPTMTAARRKLLRAEVAEFIAGVTSSYPLKDIADWDGNTGSVYMGDELSDFLWDNGYEFERGDEIVTGRFGRALSCCVRAGFDVAVAPSCGVLGYTVGDLRAVFPRGLPAWVQGFFEKPILADTPASAGVWL